MPTWSNTRPRLPRPCSTLGRGVRSHAKRKAPPVRCCGEAPGAAPAPRRDCCSRAILAGMELGIVVRPELDPESLADHARRAEDAGFSELWLWEDCFQSGGIAMCATA